MTYQEWKNRRIAKEVENWRTVQENNMKVIRLGRFAFAWGKK